MALPANMLPESMINIQKEIESDYIKIEMERRILEAQKKKSDDPAQQAADAFREEEEEKDEMQPKQEKEKPITPE